MVGVVGRRDSGQEHAVIGCALGFGTQAPHRPPRERMGPVESARQVTEHLDEPVLTSHVGQLVEQERATAILRPLLGARRQDDRRLPETMDDGNPHGVAHQETDAPPQPERAGRMLDLARPAGVSTSSSAPCRVLRARSEDRPSCSRPRAAPTAQARASQTRTGPPRGRGKGSSTLRVLVTDRRGRKAFARDRGRDRVGGPRGRGDVTVRRARRGSAGGGSRFPWGGGAPRCVATAPMKADGPHRPARWTFVQAGPRAPSSAARSKGAEGSRARPP